MTGLFVSHGPDDGVNDLDAFFIHLLVCFATINLGMEQGTK